MDAFSNRSSAPGLYSSLRAKAPLATSLPAPVAMPELRGARRDFRSLRPSLSQRLFLAGAASAAAFAVFVSPAHAQFQLSAPSTSQAPFFTYEEAVRQIADGLSQLRELQGELVGARAALQTLDPSASSTAAPAIAARVRQILQTASGIGVNSAAAGSALAVQYPTTFVSAGFDNTQLASALAAWGANNAATIHTAGQLQAALSAGEDTSRDFDPNPSLQGLSRLLATTGVQLGQLRAILLTQAQADAALSGDPQREENAAQFALAAAKSDVPTSVIILREVARPRPAVRAAIAESSKPMAPGSLPLDAKSASAGAPSPPRPPAAPAQVALRTPGAITLEQLAAMLGPLTKRSVTFALSSADEYKKTDTTHRVRLAWSGPLQSLVDQLGQIYGLDVSMDDSAIRFSSRHADPAATASATPTTEGRS